MANTDTGSNAALIARTALGGVFGLLNALADANIITSNNIGHIAAGFNNGLGVGSGDVENERRLADHITVSLAALTAKIRQLESDPTDN
jgi:hypothetical protein